MKKLYVGGLAFDTTSTQIQELFAAQGSVIGVTIPTDRDTGKQRGFAFVEMASDAEADKAMEALDGSTFNGRSLGVNVAREQRSGSSSTFRR